ncbi:MAG TPA: nicotinate-nicotinamide nucleotide adenylyltransferase [Polyangiaceae bacterium]
MNVAVFGGSFDPPHVAHLFTASYVLATGGFERVLVVPVYEHAFDKSLAPFEHRAAMCRACFAGLGAVEVSEIEASLPRPSYTERTLERLAREHPDWRLRFVMGSDALADTAKWHNYARVTELAPPFVVARRGHERPELGPPLLPEVSSSHVRRLFAAGATDSGARRELAALVPAAVIAYADGHGLYRAGATERA